MDESVLTGNITRVVENLCHDELAVLNRGMGHLLGRPDLGSEGNPLGPATIVGAFSEAVQTLKADRKIKFQIMKDLNQGPLGDIATIYADLNQHLTRLNMVPAPGRAGVLNRGSAADRAAAKAAGKAPDAPAAEMDIMAMFKRMYGSGTPTAPAPSYRCCTHADAVAGTSLWRSGFSGDQPARRSPGLRPTRVCAAAAHGIGLRAGRADHFIGGSA